MPALRRKSGIGHHRAFDSIQRRGLVRDGLRREEDQRRRRGQSGQARHGNKRDREQGERIGKQGTGNEGNEFQRIEREEDGEEKVNPARRPMADATQTKIGAGRRVRKAVLPAAGLGTRFLPATKAQPKEMLTVVDKPQIQYVVEECVVSGIEHIIIVTGKGKNGMEDQFEHAPTLEHFMERRGKKEQAAMGRRISDMVQVSYTRQKEPLGLGHAVLVAKDLVGDEPFAVLLGDVLIPGGNPATKQLIDVYAATGVGAIAVEEVPKEKTHLYGIVDGEPAPQPPFGARLLRIRDLVEKPKPEKAPSNLAITGRYVLPPQIFDCLARTKPGAGNEIQLTDALRILAQEDGLWAYIYEGISYDAGDKLGFLKATVEIALQNLEFGVDFREYLKNLKL